MLEGFIRDVIKKLKEIVEKIINKRLEGFKRFLIKNFKRERKKKFRRSEKKL